VDEGIEIPAVLDESDFIAIEDILQSPEQITQQQTSLKEAALAKLMKLGLTEDEAKAIAGL
jgi:hypothetical protein